MAFTENEAVSSNVLGSKTMAMKSKCDSCDKSYTRKYKLRMHKLAKHQIVCFQCSKCDLSFTTPQSLSSHKKIVHEGKMVKCSECDHKSTKRQGLKSHLRLMHGLEMLQCDMCDFKCASESSMRSHKKRTHVGKIYDCNQCDFTTSEYYQLTYHVKRMHCVITPFKCDECEYTTSLKIGLTRHRREKHDTVQIKCDLCAFSGNRYAIGNHMRNIHGDMKQCNDCDYKVRSSKSMFQHKRTKHQGVSFHCEECGSKFQTEVAHRQQAQGNKIQMSKV